MTSDILDPRARATAPQPSAQPAGDERERIALANRLLSANHRDSAEHARGLAMMREAADGERWRDACWFLGAYYLQVTTWPDAHAEAARWLQRAADAGVAPAIDRLSNLHLQGIGLAYSLTRALELQAHLADAGFQQAAWETGYLLEQFDDAADGASATAFARACALGYPPAYYSLGLRFARAEGAQRDPAFARALLLRAADAKFPDAREAADELVPASEAGDAAIAWHRNLKQNLDAAQALRQRLMPGDVPLGTRALHPAVPPLEAHFAAVGHPSIRIGADGRLVVASGSCGRLRASPDAWDWLEQRPKIAVSHGFATREECAHLMHKAAGSLKHPQAYLKSDSANDDSEGRQFNGQGHPPGALHADSVMRLIERRIAAMTAWSIAAMEPCSIIRYQPGEEYLPHVDSFSREQIERNRQRGDFGGQRIATFLLCLRPADEGGETYFHYPQRAVKGEAGMGLLHYNAIPDGGQDVESLHSGKPLVRGEKWMWRSTLRERSLYPTHQETQA